MTFQSIYPYLHLYCEHQGHVEIGPNEYEDSWVRLLDEGGTRFEADSDTLDANMDEAEAWAKDFMQRYFPKVVAKMAENKP